jgi:hypothetical protein
MSYNGMKFASELNSDDAIKGERAWAYNRSGKQIEVDTFWLMAREEFAQYDQKAPVKKLSEHYRHEAPVTTTVARRTEARQEAAADIARAAYAALR